MRLIKERILSRKYDCLGGVVETRRLFLAKQENGQRGFLRCKAFNLTPKHRKNIQGSYTKIHIFIIDNFNRK